MKKKIQESRYYKTILSLGTAVILVAVTIAIILYAKGYRFENRGISETGQIVLKSEPDAAAVFINNKFVAATNSTLNLPPGEYTVRIVKDGYAAWEKKLKIEKEVVTATDAILFQAVPELRRITTTGALNPVASIDKTKIAYGVASSSAYPPNNGVYVASISDSKGIFFGGGTQYVIKDTPEVSYSEGKFLFSPDGKQLLVYFPTTLASGELRGASPPEQNSEIYGNVNLTNLTSAYLLDATRQSNGDAPDVSFSLGDTLNSWQKEKDQDSLNQFNLLKKNLQKIASSSMEIRDFTVDESKFIYQAKRDFELPLILNPRIVGANSISENRSAVKGHFYVYDIKEDKNYEIVSPGDSEPQWLDTSRHYMTVEDHKIFITEYDGQNRKTVYAGPFDKNFVTPTANGNRIFFLTSLSPDLPLNLYALLMR